ncbi:MAG: 3'-5' exonuclease, partial [Candidatus Acidiferrum sp.]
QSHVIRPNGFKIPKDAQKVHGISTLAATRTGVPLPTALDAFAKALSKALVLVAHNYSFDAGIIGAEFYRLGIRQPFRGKITVCTMMNSTQYCRLPGQQGFKWPKLPELHLKLFGRKVAETHDAASDVRTCSKCFFELKRLGVIRVTKRGQR